MKKMKRRLIVGYTFVLLVLILPVVSEANVECSAPAMYGRWKQLPLSDNQAQELMEAITLFNQINEVTKEARSVATADIFESELLPRYLSRIVPLIGYDPIALQIGREVKSQFTRNNGETYIANNEHYVFVSGWNNYLRILNSLGKRLRKAVQDQLGVDLYEVKREDWSKISTVNKKRFHLPLIAASRSKDRYLTKTKRLSIQSVLRINETFLDIIYKDYLKGAGFQERPVVFGGYISPEIANRYVRSSLFYDDPVFSGGILHGKYSHLFSAVALIEHFRMNNHWFGDIAENAIWDHLIDNVGSLTMESKKKANYLECKVDTTEEIVSMEWNYMRYPSSANPVALNQALMQGFFSKVVNEAKAGTLAATRMIKVITGEDVPEELLSQTLSEIEENIKVIENFLIVDMDNDFNVIYTLSKGYPPIVDSFSRHAGFFIAQIYPDLFTEKSRKRVRRRFLMMDILENPGTRGNFSRMMREPVFLLNEDISLFEGSLYYWFQGIRAKWLEENAIPIIETGGDTGGALIYRLRAPQEN